MFSDTAGCHGSKLTDTATDPEMDDLTFEWDWGDGTPATVTSYLNGGTFPFTATDSQSHIYTTPGVYEVRVRVTDDDGGANELFLVMAIN